MKIPQVLRTCPDHKEWFAEVMTVVKAYGNARAAEALATGLAGPVLLTEDNYGLVSPLLHDEMMSIAHLRDLIGGTVNGK